MTDYLPLTRPLQSQVAINPTPQPCPSDGFNFPNFRQLNKDARVRLSQPLCPDFSVLYQAFAVANHRGWYTAVRSTASGTELIFSTLVELRTAIIAAKPEHDGIFEPKRILQVPFGKVTILALSQDDSRLFVGSDQGYIAVYDTTPLFNPGSEDVSPLKTLQLQPNAFRQILPNPGAEGGLSDLVAVVGEGRVHLLNANLESQGGWAASDLMTQPIAVAWSPKGKHIAIGLQTGDILTFSLTNKSAPHKHIPPTADAVLVSLNWLGPGHTFKTSYASTGDGPGKQHIITLDTKSSTATYVAPDHPYPTMDRRSQSAYTLLFAKWDEDAATSDGSKSVVVIGDVSSVDLEVVGHNGNQWYRHSQDNPVSLPLDQNMDDTVLLALAADLTDVAAAAPIMYVYLHDGTVQAWHLEHSKPYLGIIGAPPLSNQTTMATTEPKDSDMGAEQGPFSQPAPASTTFGFGQPSPSPFGQATTTQPSSGFGQTGFSAFANSRSTPFGQASSNSSNSGFGNAVKPASGFGAFGGTGGASPFSAGSTSTFGSTPNAFSNFGSSSTSAFGQGSFGTPSIAPGNQSSHTSPPPVMTREASMADSTPTLGGMSLGSAGPADPSKTVNSMFGTIATTGNNDPPSSNSAFGGSIVKPASGFGAFSNFKPSDTFQVNKTQSNLPLTSTTVPSSGFGQAGFSSSAFGKPSFGQSSFGQTSLGSTPAVSGGFGAFANANTSFGPPAPTGSNSGFSTFASTPSNFSSALTTAQGEPKSAAPSVGAFAGFASNKAGAFGVVPPSAPPNTNNDLPKPTPGTGAFGAFSSTSPSPLSPPQVSTPRESKPSVFGGEPPPFGGSSAFRNPTSPATSPKPGALSPPSSPEPSRDVSTPPPAPTPAPSKGGAFSNIQSTASAFKPASGYGAFGSAVTPSTSPFFKKPEDTKSTPVTIFGDPTPTKSPISSNASPAFGSSAFGRSGFGSSSTIGPPNPLGLPTTTPTKSSATSSAFDAFSGSTSPFGALGEQKKSSFADLLKIGDKDPVKPSTPSSSPLPVSKTVVETKEKDKDVSRKAEPSSLSAFPPMSISKLPSETSTTSSSGTVAGPKNSPLTGEPSTSTISASSAGSSFVNVSGDEDRNDDVEEDGEHNPDDGFLTDDNFSEDSYPEEESGEHELTQNEEGGEEDQEEEEEEDQDQDQEEEEEEEEDEGREGEGESLSEASEAAALPLPSSRSPSATPQPETPKISISPSPPAEDAKSTASPFARDSSTTPPGTPARVTKPLPGSSTTPSFGLGLGRPSTRPTRSSPLANAIASSDDEEEAKRTPKITPKPIFGILQPPSVQKLSEESAMEPPAKRPKTPPLLSTLGGKSPTIAPLVPPLNKTTSAPADIPKFTEAPSTLHFSFSSTKSSPTMPSVVPKAASAPPNNQDRPALAPNNLFSLKPASPPTTASPFSGLKMPAFGPTSTPGTSNSPPNFFGIQPPKTAQGSISSPFANLSPPTQTTPSLGGIAPPKSMPNFGPGPFGPKSSPATPPDVSNAPMLFKAGGGIIIPPGATPASFRPEAALEEGMQKECANLVMAVRQELDDLTRISHAAKQKVNDLTASAGGSRDKADLGDMSKWSLGDLPQFAQLLMQYQDEMDTITAQREKTKQTVREIQSSMLKAGTRREEIARFNKAKTDKEFARMLKARTLGPEHTETQTQLRKSIRTMRDRVDKLESHLQESKKKLARSTTGKAGFRAPTLDTINRTYRNIDYAIRQQNDDIAELAARIQRLKVHDTALTSPQRDSRLPDPKNRRPYNVTPNVAETTAAALNAERSAQRLKKALLAVRTEPLMNKKALAAPKPPASYNTPRKLTESLFKDTALDSSPFTMPDWQIDDDNFSPTNTPLSGGRRGAEKQRKHFSVPLKRSTGTPAPPVAPSFDWGPLPSFNPPANGPSLPKSFFSVSSISTPKKG